MMNEGISVADALALRNSGTNSGFGDFGGNGAWWVIILILFIAIGGWGGRGGWGNDGGGYGYGYNGAPIIVGTPCGGTGNSYISDAFNFNQLDNGIRATQNGLCDGFYAMNNSVRDVASAVQNCCCTTQQNIAATGAALQQSIANLGYEVGQGFCGVDKSIMGATFQNQAGFTALGNQLASCCCDLARGQDAIKYEMAQFANNLLVAGDKNTDRIINYLTDSKMQDLRTQVEEYRSQLQLSTQTQNIVNQLLPVAKPAYLTCSPYASAFGFTGYTNNNSGCGCA